MVVVETGESLRILVTGSGGVIGRSVVAALAALGHSVVSFDRNRPGPTTAPVPADDIREPSSVRSALKGVDGVIHLAAVSRAGPAELDPWTAHSVNVEGTRVLVESLRASGSSPWLIFASSREVYGDPNGLPVGESHPIRPKGVYGRTKVEGERLVRAYGRHGAARAAILRLSNVYGDPDDYPERVVPSFVTAALSGKPLIVRGPQYMLDLLHRDDAVQAVVSAVNYLGSASGDSVETINVASGEGIRLGELARRAVALTGSSSEIQEELPVSWTTSAYVGDISKAERLLSWRPSNDVDQGLRALIEDFRARRRAMVPALSA